MINKFIQFLKDHGFVQSGQSFVKNFTGTKSGRAMTKIYDIFDEKVTKFSRYNDTGEIYGKKKTFKISDIRYVGDKFAIQRRINYRSLEREAMEGIGLTRAIGPVSGQVYWE